MNIPTTCHTPGSCINYIIQKALQLLVTLKISTACMKRTRPVENNKMQMKNTDACITLVATGPPYAISLSGHQKSHEQLLLGIDSLSLTSTQNTRAQYVT